MSTAVSTNRASNRPSKDKHAKTASQPTQPKSEGPPLQAKATPEQIRIAQMISVTDGINNDAEFQKRVDQVIEITGRDRETCEIALHDSKNDVDKAVGMLLEGELDKGLGEWKATGKKKKQKPQQQNSAPSKTDNVSNHIDEKSKNEQINDSDKTEHREPRQESGNRRGRRFDTRPPRLARGRGREKTDVFRSERVNGEAESDSNFGTFNKDRDFEGGRGRGRGRGRGGRGRGGAGGGSGSGRGRSYNRSQRFDSGPQIDTWTNETAENAEKENSMGGWGDTAEDWNDDTWTGSLTESKIFTASAVQSNQATEEPSPLTDTTSSIGQRLDLGALLQKPSNDSETSYISQYNQQATETIKNTIGIGSGTRQYSSQEPTSQPYSNPMTNATLTNHLQPVSLGSQLPSSLSNQMPSLASSQSASAAVEALVSTFTQQSQNLTNTAIDQMNSNSVLPVSQNSASVSPPSVPQHSVLQQRTKPQRSKLPPPSKIPASAVEMPGHQMTTLDVQFGNWEFSESSQFGFGSGNESIVSSSLSSTVSSSTSSSINSHKSQVSKQSESVISSSMISTPQNNSTSVMSGQDSPRSNMFHNSPYTTPTKNDTNSLGQSKMNPPEPIPFPPSQSDRKSSPLMAPQRPGSSSSLTQGSLATSKADGGSLSFTQSAPGGYQSNSFHQTQNSVLSGTTGLSNSTGLARDSSSLSNTSMTNAAGLSNSTGLSNSSGLSSSTGLSNSTGLPRDTSGLSRDTTGLSNSSGMSSNGLSSTSGLSHTPAYSHPSTSQPSLLQTQYQTGSNQYQTSQNQYQTGQNQYPSSNQYSSQNQYQSYGQSGSNYQNPNTFSGSTGYSGSSQATQNSLYQTTVSNSYQSQSTQNSLYHQSTQSSSYPQQSSQSSYHSSRDSQAPGSYTTNVSQSGSVSFQRDPASGLATVSTQNQPAYSSQTYGTSSHQSSLPSNLQTSPITANKISETLSKISVKDSSLDTRQSPQYDNSTSTSTASLTTTTATTSLSTGTSTPSAVSSATMTTNTSSSSARTSSSLSTTTTTSKALPNLPPGVQLLGHQYIMGQMGQGTVPYIGLQQPMYANYDELMLQQRIPPLSYNYDLTGFGVPTTLTSRDQTSLGNVPYTGAENKLTRVDAQSPIPSTQQSSQSTHQQQQQHFINLPYGYYYPSMVPNAAAAAGFQFPGAMFPVPPVTNTAAHAGTTANTQFPKTYGTHAYGNNKAYEELTPGSDFSKSSYVNQSQNKVSAVSAVASVSGVTGGADIPGTGYGKTHTQMVNKKDRISKSTPRNHWIKHDGFDKQGFHAGTPPPFGLPIATGTQPLGAPTNPYAGPAPFVQMMPHQAHSQMLHAGLQQDSTSGSSRGSHVHAQQSSAQGKGTSGKYGTGYWGAS